jgi:hypothetical protein
MTLLFKVSLKIALLLEISLLFKILHCTHATPMTLIMMEEHAQKGALCLDGTAAGFFYAPSNASNVAVASFRHSRV